MTPLHLFLMIVASGAGVFVDTLMLGVFVLIVLVVLGSVRQYLPRVRK